MDNRPDRIEILDRDEGGPPHDPEDDAARSRARWPVVLAGVSAVALVWIALSLHSMQDALRQQACMDDVTHAFERLDEVVMRSENQRPPIERLRERSASLAETLRGCGAAATAEAILLQLEVADP